MATSRTANNLRIGRPQRGHTYDHSVVKVLAVLLVTLSVRPIGEPERAALAIVAAYLAQGPEAVYARLAADAPLRALPREEALREVSAGFGARENATWTLRTVEGKDFAAFHVRWPSGREERVLLRMRGGALYALGPDVARA